MTAKKDEDCWNCATDFMRTNEKRNVMRKKASTGSLFHVDSVAFQINHTASISLHQYNMYI